MARLHLPHTTTSLPPYMHMREKMPGAHRILKEARIRPRQSKSDLASQQSPMASATSLGQTKRKKLVYQQDPDGVFRLKKIDNKVVPQKFAVPSNQIDEAQNELTECSYTPVNEYPPLLDLDPPLPLKLPMPIRHKRSPIAPPIIGTAEQIYHSPNPRLPHNHLRNNQYHTKVIGLGDGDVQDEAGLDGRIVDGHLEARVDGRLDSRLDNIADLVAAHVPSRLQLRWWPLWWPRGHAGESEIERERELAMAGELRGGRWLRYWNMPQYFNWTLFAYGFCIPCVLYVFNERLMRTATFIAAVLIVYGATNALGPLRLLPYARQYWGLWYGPRGRGNLADAALAEELMEENEMNRDMYVDEYGNVLDDSYYDDYPSLDRVVDGRHIVDSALGYSDVVRRRPYQRRPPHRAGSAPADMHVYPPSGLHQPMLRRERERMERLENERMDRERKRERGFTRADGALPLPDTFGARELDQREALREREAMRADRAPPRVVKVPGRSVSHVQELPLVNEVKLLDRDDYEMMGLQRNNTVGSKRSILGTRNNYNRFMANVDDGY